MNVHVDGRILETFERFSHWTQVRYDKDCFWLAKYTWTLASCTIGLTVPIVDGIFAELPLIWAIVHTLLVMCIFVSTYFIAQFYTLDTHVQNAQWDTYDAVKKGYRNPLEIRERALRIRLQWIFGLAMLALTTIVAQLHLSVTAFLVGLVFFAWYLSVTYLSAVTPLHPNEVDKLRALLAGAKLATLRA